MDATQHQFTRTKIVRGDNCLKSIYRIRGIYHNYTVTRDIRKFRLDHHGDSIHSCNMWIGAQQDGFYCRRVESVSVTRRTRYTRGSRRTRRTINAIQVDIVDTRCGIERCILIDIDNLPDHQCTRTLIIRLHKTLEAIHGILRINHQHTVAWQIGQLRLNHQADFTALHWVICACESHRCSRTSIESVSVARWARGSRGSRSSRRTRRAIDTIQVDIVHASGAAKRCILIDIQNLPDHQCTRAWVIRLHKTLEAIHRIRRIDNQDAVS